MSRARQVVPAIAKTVPWLLDQPLGTFDLAEAMYTFKAARAAKGISATTTNRDLGVLRTLLRRTHPEVAFPSKAFEKEDNTRVRSLEPDQQTEVFGRMPEPHRSLARLACLTLMRLSEVRLLRRDQVHLEQHYLELNRPGQKKTKARQVRLSSAARAILVHALAGDSVWAFPNPDGVPYSSVHVSRVWRKAARASGLRDFTFHDLRHHGAMVLLNAGASTQTVKDAGGWNSEAMMRRYATITDRTLGDAMEAIAAYGQGTPLKLATAIGNRRATS